MSEPEAPQGENVGRETRALPGRETIAHAQAVVQRRQDRRQEQKQPPSGKSVRTTVMVVSVVTLCLLALIGAYVTRDTGPKVPPAGTARP